MGEGRQKIEVKSFNSYFIFIETMLYNRLPCHSPPLFVTLREDKVTREGGKERSKGGRREMVNHFLDSSMVSEDSREVAS